MLKDNVAWFYSPQSPVLEEIWRVVHPAIQDHTKGDIVPSAFDLDSLCYKGISEAYVYTDQDMREFNKRNKILILKMHTFFPTAIM